MFKILSKPNAVLYNVVIFAVLKILFPIFLLGLVGFIWSKWNFDYPIDF